MRLVSYTSSTQTGNRIGVMTDDGLLDLSAAHKITSIRDLFEAGRINDAQACVDRAEAARFDPPIWLRQGDEIEITVEGVSSLRNGVIRE
ncbi:MAG: hypothetical protein V3V04_03195 [Rhizobiaceae bacterium]